MSRTTLDMDPELYEHLRELAHRRRTSLKAVINELLWSALPVAAEPPPPPYEVGVFTSGFAPGVDPERLNQLVDDLEVEGRVIVPDVNLLVYAHDARAPHHAAARAWWTSALNGRAPVGLPWAVVFGFVRLVTHPRVMVAPLAPERALDFVDAWFERPNVRPLGPGPRHLALTRELFAVTGVGASLTTDTHLAALALEHGATLCSNDRDFQRFPGLRLHNPVA